MNDRDSRGREYSPSPPITTSEILTPAEALAEHTREPYTQVCIYRRVTRRKGSHYPVYEAVSVLQAGPIPKTPKQFRVADWTGKRAGAGALALRIADALYEGREPEIGPNREARGRV